MKWCKCLNRSVIIISGEDRYSFLQALFTNNVLSVSKNNSIYSCLLDRYGKYLHDFFVIYDNDKLVIDIDKSQSDDFIRRLSLYKLRSKVDIVRDDSAIVCTLWDHNLNKIAEKYRLTEFKSGHTDKHEDFVVYFDSRNINLGIRFVFFQSDYSILEVLNEVTESHYTDFLIDNAIPSSSNLEKEKSFILEFGFDYLNAIDFDKGCYIGQELVTRTKRTGVVRKKIFLVESDKSTLPQDKVEVVSSGKVMGQLLVTNSSNNKGIAILRVDDMVLNQVYINDIAVDVRYAYWYGEVGTLQ